MASFSRRRLSLFVGIALVALTGPAFGQPASGPRWALQTDVLGGYQSNVTYGLQPQGDFGTRLEARLAYRFEHQRAKFGLTLGAGTNLYAELTEYNQVTWDAGLVATWSLSRRTAIDANVRTMFGYGFGYVDTLGDVAIPPDTLRRNDSFGAALRHRLSRNTEGRLEATGIHYAFDSDEPFYRDGWSVTARAGFERSPSVDSVVSGFAEYERAATFGWDFDIERLVVDWRKPVVRHLVVALGGGVARYRLLNPPPEEPVVEPSVTPTGSAEAIGRFGDHTVTAGAARTVGQVFGYGAVGVSRSFSLAYGVALGSRLEFSAEAADVKFLEGATSRPLATSRGRYARAGLSYTFGRALRARVDYSYWRRGEGSLFPSHHTVWAGLRREFTWR